MTDPISDVKSASNVLPSDMPPMRLLLVDDDDLFRESLGLNLEDEGFSVTSFSNGPDTLAFFTNGGTADVLLLDWRMPGMDGLAVLREIRALCDRHDVWLIADEVFTGYGRTGPMWACEHAGIAHDAEAA